MEKKMVINAATCDVRKVSQETLEAYEHITINAAMILADERSRELLARYPVTMNCSRVLDVEGNVQVSTINGIAQIKSSDIPVGKRFLFVNGSLEIGPNTESVLEQCVGIFVNGSVTYPESMSGILGMMTVNGSSICYPDGAVILKRSAVIDRLFVLRAKNALYWSAKRLIMVDPQLDPAKLEAKGVRFSSREVILTESKVEDLIGLIDEKANIVMVPDGTAVITDDVTLDDVTVKKYGKKLYIIGNVKVNRNSAGALEQLEYLNVRGDVFVVKDMTNRLLEIAQEISGELKVLRGRNLCDKISVRISKWMLEQEKDGVSVTDCVSVKIDEDVDKELIIERLSISDCASVRCTSEQEDAVAVISQDVAKIGEAADMDDMIKDTLGMDSEEGGVLGAAKGLLGTTVINASDYVM